MATYLKYTFPSSNPTDVCLQQSALAGTNLLINGNLAGVNGTVNFLNNGYCRNLSFSSSTDISSVTISIAGVQNGVYISENLTGPNNQINYSVNYYDVVYAITVSAAVTNLSVGTGFNGFFKAIPIDLTKNPTSYALSIASLTTGNSYNTALWSTLDNIVNNNYAYTSIVINNVGTLNAVKSFTANGALYIMPSSPLVNNLLVQVGGNASSSANGLQLIFIQT